MTLTRIYIPLNAAGLRRLDADRAVTGAPFLAYAVTDAVRASAPAAGQDQWEYSALGDAVLRSAELLSPREKRRLVAAADVESELVGSAVPSDSGDFIEDSAVLILESVALNRIASFQVDADEASEDDELLWYDVTELPVILALL